MASEKYNVVVIGAGTAGLVTAAGTAGLGGRVALIERSRMGGDCLNTGCVPSKALIASARLIDQIRHAEDWGLESTEPAFTFEAILRRMRARRERLAVHDSQERFESLGVDVFRGDATFVSPREVRVGGSSLRATNFVIATGSRSSIPPIDGLKELRPYTNETIFDELEKAPARLAILGGGPIGCELGQVFARLGVAVTILQRPARLLPREDAEAGELVRRKLEADGVAVLTGVEAKRALSEAGTFKLDVGRERPVNCDAILVAAGRVPNVEGLNLEAAGVAYTKAGVTTNSHLQTSQPHIYAAGDVVSASLRFTHVADHHARTVVRNILFPWLKAKVETEVIPWCTFTSPEVARVGLNEDEARKRGVAFDLFTQPIAEVDRAVLESEEAGFARVLTARGKDRILGATLVSERAGDLIVEFASAMKHGIGLSGISKVIHPYPTFSEIARKVSDQQQRKRLTPAAQRALAALYRWRRR